MKSNGYETLILEIIKKNKIFITHEVKDEYEYRFPDELNLLEFITLYPKIEIDFESYKLMGFDPADASLLEYSKNDENIIITEDQLMLNESISNKRNIIQLADYFGLLYDTDFLTRRELYHIIKILRQFKNITKKKEKELLNLRNPK